jgi:hypothetical protein
VSVGKPEHARNALKQPVILQVWRTLTEISFLSNLKTKYCKKKYKSPKRQNPGNRMTQSHLPRTGRGVTEAVITVRVCARLLLPAFSI